MKSPISRRTLLKASAALGVMQAAMKPGAVMAQETSDLDAKLFPGFRASRIDTNGDSV